MTNRRLRGYVITSDGFYIRRTIENNLVYLSAGHVDVIGGLCSQYIDNHDPTRERNTRRRLLRQARKMFKEFNEEVSHA